MKIRGFEICKGFEDTAILPTRGSKNSAGYDFYSPKDFVLKPKETILIMTGIKAYMKDNEVMQVYIRSSIGIKKHTINANCVCVIDADYYNNPKNEGNIILGLYNRGENEVDFKKGERLVQGIFTKYLKADNDNTKIERNGGIGSTTELSLF